MSKPQLNLKCEIGFSASPASDISTVSWTDVTSYMRLQDGISLSRGRQDETQQVGAGTATFSFNNRDGRFTPGDTSGAYYPNVKLRRPIRLSRCANDAEALLSNATFWIDAAFASSSQTVSNLGTGGSALDATLGSTSGADSNDPKWLPYAGTAYVYLPGVASNYPSVPDAAALDLTGDLTVMCRVALDDWTPSAIQCLSSKFITSTANRSWEFRVQTSGTIELITSADGSTAITHTSTVAPTLTDGTAYWLAATIDVDNGAAGHDVRFFYAADSASVPSSWTQIGSTVTTAGTTSIFSGSADFLVGATVGGGTRNAAGKFYRATLANGIGAAGVPGGTTVLDVDTSLLTSGSATSWTTTTGQVVSINRSTSGRKAAVVTENKWLLGTDDYLEVADNALLDFGASDSFTVLAVVRQWGTVANFVRYVSKYAGSGAGWELLTNGSGGLQTDIYDGTNSASRNNGTITAGALSVIGVKGDRTGNTFGILNGTTAFTTTGFGSVADLSNAQPMRIGVRSGTAVQYGAFELVAVAVFRSALSAAQITAISDYYATRAASATSTSSPYSPVWTGYIEEWGNGWNQGVQPVVQVRASDLMARVANRTMDTLVTEEQLYDTPILFYPLNDSAGSITAGNQSTTSVATLAVTQAGTGGTATFGTTGLLGADQSATVLALTRSDASNGKYLTQTYNPLSGLAAVSGVTLEAYIYLPVSVPAETVRAVELARYASFDLLAIDLNANAPQVTLTIGSTTVTTTAGSAINDGAWHHVAAWYDGANVKCYVDGVETGSSAAVLGTFTGSILTVGGKNNGTTLANGWFAGVAAYASALSTTRLAAHAAGVTGATGESSLARFQRIARLAIGSWAASSSAYTASATMCAQPFDGSSASSLLYQVSDAEIAPVYVTPSGTLAWTGRAQRTSAATTTEVSATIVASSTGFTTTDALVVNQATYTRPNGATVTVSDAASQALYGKVSQSGTLYVNTDAQLTATANYVVNSRSTPQLRTGSLTVDLHTADATTSATTLLAVDVNSVVRVTSVPLGSITTVDVFVEGVNDYITPNSWTRTWNTSPLRAGGQAWVLGSSSYSQLGTTTILGA